MRILYYSLLVVIVDQITKILVKGINLPSIGLNIQGMTYGSSKEVIGKFFRLTFIENPGMAFGLQPGGKLFLSLFTVVATILIVYFIWRNRHEKFSVRFPLALILGGAVGNMIDRLFYGMIYGYAPLFYGKVVDFFHFDTPDFTIFGRHFDSFPIFNVADTAVTIGFIFLLFTYKAHENKDKIVVTEPVETPNQDELTIEDYYGRALDKYNPDNAITEEEKKHMEEKTQEIHSAYDNNDRERLRQFTETQDYQS